MIDNRLGFKQQYVGINNKKANYVENLTHSFPVPTV